MDPESVTDPEPVMDPTAVSPHESVAFRVIRSLTNRTPPPQAQQ